MRSPRRRIIGLALTLVVSTTAVVLTAAADADAGTVGAGSYAESLPAGAKTPSGCGTVGTNPRQFMTSNAPAGAVPTNDWWSSLLFKRGDDCNFSQALFAGPAAYRPSATGLGLSYQTDPAISGSATGVGEFHYPYAQHVVVGVAGLNAPRALVDGYTDWTVTPYWTDGTRTLKATIGHGLPMSYYQVTGGDALISVVGTPTIWQNSGNRIGWSIGGHEYVAYGPSGSTWSVSGTTIRSSLAGKGYFSVAVLPNTADRVALSDQFAVYAHSHVTGSKMSYTYDQAAGTVSTTYTLTTTAREGSANGTVIALYPHQWRYLNGSSPLAQTYVSPRGAMKVVTGTSFRTVMKYTGVLPEVPAVGDSSGSDLSTITSYLNSVLSDPAAFRGDDTYWTGKGLGRAARIAEIADQLNLTSVRDSALNVIRTRLTDWFTASSGKSARLFYYNRDWGTLVGYPASYGSDEELNDHHFHYGYFVAAAATLAKFDPTWASTSRYGGMVDLLIRDANNYDRNDSRFPFLRDFDVYEGHDWASGHGAFGAGNNQESSSEGQNFNNALIQWGQATGNTTVRDAGIWLHTTQAAAINEYWFDVRNENFPANWGHNYTAIVWGSGGAYATWFSGEHEMIVGINMLPITGGQLYLGDYPASVRSTYAEMVRNKGGEPAQWKDMLWQYLALGDPDAALSKFRADPNYTSEEGESKAHTFHWIRNLAALGQVDTGVTANHPLAKVFAKNGARTYVASNITNTALTVNFSDGRSVAVPAGKTVATGAQNWSGGNATGGGVVNPPTDPPPSGCGDGTLASQGRPVTTSSNESNEYLGSNAVDGNTATRWASAFSDPQWIQIDLGAARPLARAELSWEAAYGSAYRIEASTDGSSWTTVVNATGRTGGVESHALSGTARYVRLYGTQRGTTYGYSLFEFKVYACGDAPSAPPATDPPTTPPPATGSWATNVAYPAGAEVTYGTARYRCRQAHTSLAGWEPPNVPALWLAI